jgi:zinc/manganese transport system substrate-binding protein
MKDIFFVLLSLILTGSIFAGNLDVVTTYPYIASIVEEIGKDKVDVIALANGEWDPHTIVPKPSFIAKLRKADLLIINGAQLEIGWLPQLVRQANNPEIQTGATGLLDLSKSVELIEAPTSITRAQGDIHPDGNPHFCLDFENIPKISGTITERLSKIDADNKMYYEKNNSIFIEKFKIKEKEWTEKLKKLKGASVIEYHKLYDYLIRRIGLNMVSTIEPVPGIPPTSKHIASLGKIISTNKVEMIFQDVYHSKDAAEFLANKYNVKLKVIPHDVGAVKDANDVISLFDEIVRRIIIE